MTLTLTLLASPWAPAGSATIAAPIAPSRAITAMRARGRDPAPAVRAKVRSGLKWPPPMLGLRRALIRLLLVSGQTPLFVGLSAAPRGTFSPNTYLSTSRGKSLGPCHQ